MPAECTLSTSTQIAVYPVPYGGPRPPKSTSQEAAERLSLGLGAGLEKRDFRKLRVYVSYGLRGAHPPVEKSHSRTAPSLPFPVSNDPSMGFTMTR